MKWNYISLIAAMLGSLIHGSLIQEVEKFLSDGDQMDFKGATDFILLIGSTGVGKSTLSKFITHDETLHALKVNRKMVLQDNGTISTVTSKSMTLLPNIYQDPESGEVLIDCPGFSDTRKPKFEIAASYYVKKILEYAEKVKIILVENYFSLQEGRDRLGLIRLLKHLSELIPNIERFHGSVALIANKVESSSNDEDVKGIVLDFLNTTGSDLRNQINDEKDLNSTELEIKRNTLRVVDVIFGDGSGNNLGLLRTPRKPGSPWQAEDMMKCYTDIRDLIFNRTPWVDNKDQVYRFTLTSDSKVFIRDKLVPANNENVMREISKACSAFMSAVNSTFLNTSLTIPHKNKHSATLKAQFNEISSSLKTIQDLAQLNENLKTILPFNETDPKALHTQLARAYFYFDIIGFQFNSLVNETQLTILAPFTASLNNFERFYEFMHPFGDMLDDYTAQSQRYLMFRQISNSADFKEFILELSKFNLDIRNKRQIVDIPLNQFMCDDFNQIMRTRLNHTVTYKYNKQSNHLLVMARNFLISDMGNKMLMYTDVKSVHIIAEKTIFIDSALTFSSIHLSIVAPKIKIVGHQVITLKGNDAAPFPNNAADSTTLTVAGKEGQVGYPGFNAGNFLMLALEVVHSDQLTVKNIGGRGGRGQNGGRGSNGLANSFPDRHSYIVGGTVNAVRDYLSKLGSTQIFGDSIEVTRRNKGVPPSAGGNGGVGGPGGKPGQIILKVQNIVSSKSIKTELAEGKQGDEGDGGSGGIGMTNCVKIHFKCQKHTAMTGCNIWDQSCSTRWEFHCYSTDLGSSCAGNKITNGHMGTKGGNHVKPADYKIYPLEIPSHIQLWTEINDEVAANKTVEQEFNMLHLHAQDAI